MQTKPKLIALNVGLAAGLALIVWQGRARWDHAQAVHRADVNVPVKRITPPPTFPVPRPEAAQATKYADVATKNLFSKDRNPSVVVEAPKVEAPKVMPPLPIVYGALSLPSGTSAIMAEKTGSTSRSVRVGDSIGDFKILALDTRKVTFEWDGKPVERNLDDLADRSGGATPSSAGGGGRGPAAPPPPSAAPLTSKVLGAESGTADAPSRGCTAGDASPVGTVVDGYRKTGLNSPFGLMNCQWVPVK